MYKKQTMIPLPLATQVTSMTMCSIYSMTNNYNCYYWYYYYYYCC